MKSWLKRLFNPTTGEPPLIMTKWGPVTEAARLQAAMNMRANDELKHDIERRLAKEMGSAAKGIAEARRRYPEAYQEVN